MSQIDVGLGELDTCATQVRAACDPLEAAAQAVRGLAPDTGRSDTATMAANASRDLLEAVTAVRSSLLWAASQVAESAQSYRDVEQSVAARLGGR